MTGRIEVIQPGLFSTIQDTGRFGYAKFGVPVSGAMDSYAATMANLILNNDPGAAVLEITQMGPKLKFSSPVNIVLIGAKISARINNTDLINNRIIPIASGDVLSFGKRMKGARAYLGITGGFKTEEILQSRSWYQDLTAHSRLQKGMSLEYEAMSGKPAITASSVKTRLDYMSMRDLDVSPGPEFGKLTNEEMQALFSTKFHVSRNNNRMGIQLEEKIDNNLQPIITGPVVPGTVQFTPGGRLIILMRDCQTTGGYPRILQLSEFSMNLLAQKVEGEEISFLQPVTV